MIKYKWIFGEHLSKTMANNSFYLWKKIVEISEEVDAFFILEKTKANKKKVSFLSKTQRKKIVWKNSLIHYKIFINADMAFVSTSYKDILPKHFGVKKIHYPIIYLQHGVLGIKKIYYNGNSYNNNLFRFFIFNKKIKKQFIKDGNFGEYQIYESKYQPRYQNLAKVFLESQKKPKKTERKKILWFATWREYLGENKESKNLIDKFQKTLHNESLLDFLKNSNYDLNLCFHDFFDISTMKKITQENKNINILPIRKTNIMKEIAESDFLITDYSSLAFDFGFLNKPVILFAPDFKTYSKTREFYCDLEKDYKDIFCKDTRGLLSKMKKAEKLPLPFSKTFGKPNYIRIIEGDFLEKIYKEFLEIQKNKILFLGYNFYGIGGTVSSTISLAEGLLKKGYLVELLSLNKTTKKPILPGGLLTKAIHNKTYSKSKFNKVKKKILKFFPKNKKHKYFDYDCNSQYISNYTSWKLNKILKKTTVKTVVSTRETIHLFLNDNKNPTIKNKIYFFHTDYDILNDSFSPKLIKELESKVMDKVIFVSDNIRDKYIKNTSLKAQDNVVIPNSILENKVLKKSQIKDLKPTKNKIFKGIYLTRVSKDRKNALKKLIKFAKYLNKKKKSQIVINVFGKGNYQKQFLDLINKEKVNNIINYKGLTTNPHKELRNHDFALTFSENDSFGMVYLEAIFNGIPVFTKINDGSRMVLADFPELFFNSNYELENKIKNYKYYEQKTKKKRYEKLYEKYSQKKVTSEFLEFIGKGEIKQ